MNIGCANRTHMRDAKKNIADRDRQLGRLSIPIPASKLVSIEELKRLLNFI